MTDQRELARMFLEALFLLDNIQQDSKKLFKSLQAFQTVMERNLPLTPPIATRLVDGLSINFHYYAQKTVN